MSLSLFLKDAVTKYRLHSWQLCLKPAMPPLPSAMFQMKTLLLWEVPVPLLWINFSFWCLSRIFVQSLGWKLQLWWILLYIFEGLICFGSLPSLINTGSYRDRSFQTSSLYYFNCYYESSFYFINYFLYFLKLCYNYIIGPFPFLPQSLLHITSRFLSKSWPLFQ